MDILKFKIIRNDRLLIDGIDFSGSLFIKPIVNGEDVISEKFDNDALMVLSEWEKCAKMSGRYLLFTSLIGIADDGGWELCDASHDFESVFIKIPYDDKIIKYNFDKVMFLNSIESLAINISSILTQNPHFHLEPKNIIFPE